MWARVQVFRVRRLAKYLSKAGGCQIYANYKDVRVGSYREGRKVW